MKRTFDIIVAILGLACAAPVMGIVAIAILLDDGRPLLFKCARVGKNFRPFSILKFRSMRHGAAGLPITAGDDPRITRVGRLLRKTKLDEVPQLWNVIRGDMSLVGPRPEAPQYVEAFAARYRHILTVRPGITDPASVRFRNEEEILRASGDPVRMYLEDVLPQKLTMAEQYIRDHSLFGDIALLFRTVYAVVTGD